jgi:hypothetical protein
MGHLPLLVRTNEIDPVASVDTVQDVAQEVVDARGVLPRSNASTRRSWRVRNKERVAVYYKRRWFDLHKKNTFLVSVDHLRTSVIAFKWARFQPIWPVIFCVCISAAYVAYATVSTIAAWV